MNRRIRRWRLPVTVTVAAALAIPLSLPAQAAQPTPPKGAAQGWASQPRANKAKPSAIPTKERAKTLGARYKASKDAAFTTSGDAAGFHLLVADEARGYGWKTAATLREDGFDADTWIGNACLTASGKYAAVAYAPRTFTNRAELMARGAFAAVVDLASGKVTKLPFTASLAYFSPGCGNGEQAVFTQLTSESDKKQQTRLITVNTHTGKQAKPLTFPSQVTSAIPTKNGIVAAHGNKLVRLNGAKETELVRTRTVPFQLTADADGGVTFIERELDEKTSNKPQSWAKYLTPAKTQGGKTAAATVAAGKLAEWDLTGTASGRVFITGKAASKGKLPARIANPGGLAEGARISSLGHAAVSTTWADGKTSLITSKEADAARSARTQLKVLATGKTVTLDAKPAADGKNASTGIRMSPALSSGTKAGSSESGTSTQTVRTQALSASPSSPSEGSDERYCAVARNDVKKQAFQPTPRQVEWAVDQAVVGKLDFYRSPNWKNTDMGGYQPQGLFPPKLLDGDPNGALDTEDGTNDKWHIPAQVLLGITAQESNMWQATRFAVPGVTSNSLIGNYYGTQYTSDGTQADPWRINFSEADCGYGITQATDGMRLAGKEKDGETALSTLTQEAVALDYTANIAYGAQILSDKWNQTRRAGMKLNDGHPQWIENWFFALWAYNSGFYEDADSAGHKGVGWTNNPANPLWKANRTPFLEDAFGNDDYSHAAHPQDWPYEEKVIGWAARPISAMFAPGDFQAGYRPAWWNSTTDRTEAKPPLDLFCDSSNNCDPSKISDNASNDPGQGACTLDAGDSDTNSHWLHCWWSKSAQWKDCTITGRECGNAVHRFNTTYPEQADANSYPPRCDSGLPSNALIVDDLPDGTVPAGSSSRGCGAAKSDGTFDLTYQPSEIIDSDTGQTITTYPGKIDTHQIGAAYQNHFWFTHTRSPESNPPPGDRMKVTGTWKLGQQIPDGQAKVYAHIPDHGAQTSKAEYRIKTIAGTVTKAISQADNQSNKWVDLGAYQFGDQTPEVSLDNFNGGDGSKDIAYDAIAFVPGDYSGMPQISFSDPDINAAQPDDITLPSDMTPDVPTYGEPIDSIQQEFSNPKDTYVDWCSAKPFGVGLERKVWTNRYEGCVKGQFGFIKTVQGTVTATATFDFQAEIKLHQDSGGFNTSIKMMPTDMTGEALEAPMYVGVSDSCSLDCKKNGPRTEIGNSFWESSFGDSHVYSIQQIWDWGQSRPVDLLFPGWKMTGELGGTWTANNADISSGASTQIRCDTTVVSYAGCVFDQYRPTYVMNSQKFPAAAAHAWLVQEKLPGHFGSKKYGLPLTYLGSDVMSASDPTKKQSLVNREVICPTSWARNQNATLSPELDEGTKPDTWSCDEFAFAASYNSAGMAAGYNPVNSGDQCLQTYAKKGSDGIWHLLPDPRYALPTWKENCGRSTISNNQNTQSMRPFGSFINRNRLTDKDQYWLDLNGFTG